MILCLVLKSLQILYGGRNDENFKLKNKAKQNNLPGFVIELLWKGFLLDKSNPLSHVYGWITSADIIFPSGRHECHIIGLTAHAFDHCRRDSGQEIALGHFSNDHASEG